MSMDRVLIFIPTYNESENVRKIFQQIKHLHLDADILFLDDNSPDGTGEIIDKIVAANSDTFVIHRRGKLGIGSAHLEGINWSYQCHYEVLITMDCDFTHSPDCILDFLNNSNGYDIVVGSRYMRKGSLDDWNLFRKTLTHLGHFLTHKLLNMPYDASGAFRLYRLHQIPREIFELVTSHGYSFFFESLLILHINKYSIHEIPIDLPARTYGHSKMAWKDAWASLWYLFVIFKRRLFNKKSLLLHGNN